MAQTHSPADDIVFDLVSVQYHALKAATAYDSYLQDAEGHEDVQAFFKQCAEQDAERAKTCHRLLGQLTGGGLGAS
jgi:hypothetical protein